MRMFSRAMWRFLTPYLIAASRSLGTAVVYAEGAPAWTVYLGGFVALLVVLVPARSAGKTGTSSSERVDLDAIAVGVGDLDADGTVAAGTRSRRRRPA